MKTDPQSILAIVTGTSRGIGLALQEVLLNRSMQVISINRHGLPQDEIKGLHPLVCDLGKLDELKGLTDQISELISGLGPAEIWLIHNAAIIGNIRPMALQAPEMIRQVIDTNLSSPLILSSLILKDCMERSIPLRIAHISSGAAFQPIHGIGPYCISKAGLEMASRILDLETARADGLSISIGPGVVDTGMQQQLRNSRNEDFRERDRFVRFQEKNLLQDPARVAQKIVELLEMSDLQSGEHYALEF